MRHSTNRHRTPGGSIARHILLVAFASIALTGCTGANEGRGMMRQYRTAYFDSERFAWEGGRVAYEDENAAAHVTGVDVSDHQGVIDWQAVAADGIDFAMVRVGWRGNTEGYLHADEQFEQNWAGAREAGVACGAYFYSQAITEDEARDEALFALGLLSGRELDYPVVFDYEPNDGNRLAGIDGDTATRCARAFCDAIREAGYDPMVYGNGYDLQYVDTTQLPDVPIWYAEYATAPSYGAPFAIWQYTGSGTVAGIATPADLNLDMSLVAPSTQG